MKILYRKAIHAMFITLLIMIMGLILYKGVLSSHKKCKALNSKIEDYRYCMNI